MKEFEYFFKTAPTVFLTGEYYQIMAPVTRPSLMCVRVGDKRFYDECNGIMRSSVHIHRVKVPKDVLDVAGGYEIAVREMLERKPYFSDTGKEYVFPFSFNAVRSQDMLLYHISDSHNHISEAMDACRKFEGENGRIDFLIVNGDISDFTHKTEDFDTVYRLTGELSCGNIPVIFSRGNHDTRGLLAENMENYTPTYNGRSYYTFSLGDLWGLVLDCGEDKDDSHDEYAGTICCHEFRLRQTQFIKEIINNSAREYASPEIKKRIVISHVPFMRKRKPPFDIEEDLYAEWSRYLGEYIQPHLALCGHEHTLSFGTPDKENGYPCPVLVGTMPYDILEKTTTYVGTGIKFTANTVEIICNDNNGNVALYKKFDI